MKTVSQLLKQSYLESDETKVSVKVKASASFLREHARALSAMGATVVGAPSARKAAAKKTAAKKTAAKKPKAAAAKPAQKTAKAKTAVKAKASTAKKTTSGSKRAASRINLDAVRGAIAKKKHTPQAIADAIKADARQVHKALSRYTKAGHVVRVDKGRYGLPR